MSTGGELVAQACTVLIASPDLLPELTERTSDSSSELLPFSDAEALRALEVITNRKPRLVMLERQFATTPRGAALINRIKADPALTTTEIRVVAYDSHGVKMSARQPPPAPVGDEAEETAETIEVEETIAIGAPQDVMAAQPLDQRGTRRAPRFKITGAVGVLVDGNAATLVDLSQIGAQVVSSTVLKPNQRIRMALADDHGSVRFNAAVAWASFEIPPQKGPQYRAGIEFVDADTAAVDGFCHRHKAN